MGVPIFVVYWIIPKAQRALRRGYKIVSLIGYWDDKDNHLCALGKRYGDFDTAAALDFGFAC